MKCDNFVLVPASELPFIEQWKALAQTYPSRDALIVLPLEQSNAGPTAKAVIQLLEQRGRKVHISLAVH